MVLTAQRGTTSDTRLDPDDLLDRTGIIAASLPPAAQAEPPRTVPRAARPPHRHGRWLVAAAAAGLIVIGWLAGSAFSGGHSAEQAVEPQPSAVNTAHLPSGPPAPAAPAPQAAPAPDAPHKPLAHKETHHAVVTRPQQSGTPAAASRDDVSGTTRASRPDPFGRQMNRMVAPYMDIASSFFAGH